MKIIVKNKLDDKALDGRTQEEIDAQYEQAGMYFPKVPVGVELLEEVCSLPNDGGKIYFAEIADCIKCYVLVVEREEEKIFYFAEYKEDGVTELLRVSEVLR